VKFSRSESWLEGRGYELSGDLTIGRVRGYLPTVTCFCLRPAVSVSWEQGEVFHDGVWVADRAMQIHGGYGYTTEFIPERWWRDLGLMPIGGGTSEINATVVVKGMTKGG
jgi:hypothetical protein